MDESSGLSGIGLFTGRDVTVSIQPGDRSGIRFEHTDGRTCPASATLVTNTQRRTTLTSPVMQVQMVEHVLAALWGSGIQDAIVQIDAEELPMLDGSAFPYLRAIESWPRPHLEWRMLRRRIEWQSPTARFVMEPFDGFAITYHLMHRNRELSRYSFTWSPESFQREIAMARTFAFAEDWSILAQLPGVDQRAGFLIAERDDLEIFPDAGRYSIPHATVISHEPPRFPEEAARHKILDLIGDWALFEHRVACRIHAWGTGHTENLIMLQRLAAALQLDFSRSSF